MPAVLIDVGGVLVPDHLTEAAADWGRRLGIGAQEFLAAVFGGSDDTILVGRVTQAAWWAVVAGRLGVGHDAAAEIRRDLVARQTWDDALLACLHGVRGRAAVAVVSNAWPGGISDIGRLGFTDTVVLSCEVGWAKPDPRIYEIALQRVGVDPAQTLFIDDTPGHVEAARSLGMTGHLHTTTAATIAQIEAFTTPSRPRTPQSPHRHADTPPHR